MSEYTTEQETIVLKILSIDKNDYYKILHVEKSASETEIKKSYRKLAIKLHPDKNKHPKSSEAFKKLAKAFEVLSDLDKKRIFDQTGFDPDSRGGGGASSGFSSGSGATAYNRRDPFSAFSANPGFNQGFDQDDILNFMFGGAGQSPFTTFSNGNGFSFSFGGPGPFGSFQQQQQRLHHQQQQQQQQQQRQRRTNEQLTPMEQLKETLKQLLPIILFLLIPLLSNIFSGDDSSVTGSRLPKYSFDPQPALPIERVTTKYKIPYYINEKTFTNNGGYQDPDHPKLKTLDKRVENQYINNLKHKCHNENLKKQDAIQDSSFLFFVNEKKLAEANAMDTPSCDRLSDLGLL